MTSKFDHWSIKADENVDQWGIQHPAVVLLAIQEELGEVTKAYLEATYEDGDPAVVEEEIDDLAPLLIQLVWSIREHPRAFEEGSP